MVLSDRIAVMRAGVLQQIGPPMEVYRRPANLFVAAFIGSPQMNFFEVELQRTDGRLEARLGERALRLPLEAVEPASLASLGTARQAILGIRPTDLALGEERELALPGEVFLAEPIGPVTYLDVDIGGHAAKGYCDPDAAPPVGTRVVLSCPAARVHLFDPATEQRL